MQSNERTTKDKILNLLKKNVKLTVSELTYHLAITDMAVRKHLSTMAEDGLIQTIESRQATGRPTKYYLLSQKAEKLFPTSYEGMSVEFLTDIHSLYGDASINHLFEKREERLTNEYAHRLSNKSPEEKVKELASIQHEKGYMAEVSQLDNNTFELIEYNCPIMAIANKFHVACQCETSMFTKVLETNNVQRTHCKTEGNDHCKFAITF